MLVEHFSGEAGSRGEIGVACAYCEYKLIKARLQTPQNLLASLWKDLALNHADLSEVVQDVYKKNKDRATKPSLKEVSKALHSEISRYSRVFVILDALDECPEEDRFREYLVRELRGLPANTKLIITSRGNVDVEDEFKDVIKVDIIANEKDVRAYLKGQLSRFNEAIFEGPNGSSHRDEIIKTIIDCAGGM